MRMSTAKTIPPMLALMGMGMAQTRRLQSTAWWLRTHAMARLEDDLWALHSMIKLQ